MLELADNMRRKIALRTAQRHKAEFGRFMTSSSVTRFMVGMFLRGTPQTCLLDADEGVDTLSCAFLDCWVAGGFGVKKGRGMAYEVDDTLCGHLAQHFGGGTAASTLTSPQATT